MTELFSFGKLVATPGLWPRLWRPGRAPLSIY